MVHSDFFRASSAGFPLDDLWSASDKGKPEDRSSLTAQSPTLTMNEVSAAAFRPSHRNTSAK
jgi:hypothetical protein